MAKRDKIRQGKTAGRLPCRGRRWPIRVKPRRPFSFSGHFCV